MEFKIASEQVKDKTQDFKEFPCHYPPPLLSFRVCVKGFISCIIFQRKSFGTTILKYGQTLKDFMQRYDKVKPVF